MYLEPWAYEAWRQAAMAAEQSASISAKCAATWALACYEDEDYALSIDWSRHALFEALGEESAKYQAALQLWEAI